MNYALTALFTTLLSVIVYMVISRISKRVKKPSAPVYAVTR
jgi:putative effector of murein hydrolase